MNKVRRLSILTGMMLSATLAFARDTTGSGLREHLLMDQQWRFAFGHPYDTKKDFNNGTSYFSYITKAGYGDGAAAAGFDDRTWRQLNLPHDWAVEQPFSARASYSHGFKAIGRNFPEQSVGWYRKSFKIPASDIGRRISVAFDGVFRNSIVWVNGHYLGNEPSGYTGFEYDITDYLNYGGDNVIAVRVDVTLEEGWFYEGAGIYRHVWLNKTSPVHVVTNGSFVTSSLTGKQAKLRAGLTLRNDGSSNENVYIIQSVIDAEGKMVAKTNERKLIIKSLEELTIADSLLVNEPRLWNLETPWLYQLVSTVVQEGKPVDMYTTSFGIRTLHWDANEGFFLNGKALKIKGTNNHQDHAGVGSAMPDGLQDFRIRALKAFGSNAYRCSHNPPTPELLDACDRLGMLVIDENRLMGITNYHLDALKKLILRDRNHPSVVSWSIGNEEWGIENSVVGARIATRMQAIVKSLDTTRAVTAAFSGAVTQGISSVVELMGYNYVANKNTDEHHKKFPAQFSWGTEEGSTVATRGIYTDDLAKHYRAAYDVPQQPKNFFSIEQGWKHYAARPYLGGMFIWTGFDYRGEPTPFGWPSVTSYFGMLDLCGFPKDDTWYLKSWWMDQPVVHILPHWNWPGKQGQPISVWVYSNCAEVELLVNKKSLGKKTMERNGHLEWQVSYQPGTLEAVGYNQGKRIVADEMHTTGAAAAIRLTANETTLRANGEDISVLTVASLDQKALQVPDAGNEIIFSVSGPGRIIGVGNGDPTSLEAEKFVEKLSVVPIENLKELPVADLNNRPETAIEVDDRTWKKAFTDERMEAFGDSVKALVYRGRFVIPKLEGNETVRFFYNSLGKEQSVYINGELLAERLPENKKGNEFLLKASQLRTGANSIAILATPLLKKHSWENVNTDPGLLQIMQPAPAWKRKLFNGLAQVIVQSTGEVGEIVITASSDGLKPAVIKLSAEKAARRPAVDGE